jgi:hypothetical protein
MSYWKAVPRGIWRVVDTIDALNALRDPESRFIFEEVSATIIVYGPRKKALIIDKSCLNEEQLKEFVGD